MTADPVPHVRAAARALREAGATLVAGHSAHAFHGVTPGVLFDLGDRGRAQSAVDRESVPRGGLPDRLGTGSEPVPPHLQLAR
ncbi:MAG: hypothetical protein E6G64_12680 [Actinobacteria bacterium]|nr:MAG: hypothetical protein E6G64_12680 [Actinomycetota bacterium]